MKIYPDINKVKELSKEFNLIPMYTEILADLETPVSAFMKIDQKRYSFLLESVEGGENVGRYSFLGSEPALIFRSRGKEYKIIKDGKYLEEDGFMDNPLNKVREIINGYKPYCPEDLPPFFGGAVGYLSYDTIRLFENIPESNPDELDLDDIVLIFTDSIVIFDHAKHKLKIVYNLSIKEDTDIDALYKKGLQNIKYTYDLLNTPLKTARKSSIDREIKLESNLTKEEFTNIVEATKEYIKAGDIFQAVLSRRFKADIKGLEKINYYRALRSVNPSPYMFYLHLDNVHIIGSSPETLVKHAWGKVTVRPIAGTRRRGKTIEDERRMEKELLADEKEIAEHVMLIDLGRNDVGRVCKYNTVKVPDKMVIEKYSHVMHIVSSVEGELEEGKDSFDVFEATFPAGTLTGAPKIRAMEIIEELEPVKRNIYGGAIGYFSFAGNMDVCIAIRTAVIKDDFIYLQAGGGLVYDSKPELEWLETKNKAGALVKALEIAKDL
jgi:anthranilate synthase component 1